MVKNYTDLKLWQKSIQFVIRIYQDTEDFPKREYYGLAAQIRKSAVSIASNIAEGSARHSDKEFNQFLIISRGSLAELYTQLLIAQGCGYIDREMLDQSLATMNEIGKMLHALRKTLKA